MQLKLGAATLAKEFLARLKYEFAFMRGNLLVLIVSWMFFNFAYSLVFPFESLYIRELGASPFILGLMSSVGSALLALVRIPGAYIADRYGRREIIVAMTYGVALSYLFYALAPSWQLVLIGIIISNLCLIYQPALQAIQADSIPPERRGMGYAASNVIPLIPAIIAPAIAGFLVETYSLVPGMRVAYGIVVACGLAAAMFRMFFLKETLDSPKRIKLKELGDAFKESISSIVEAWRFMPRSVIFLTIAFLISAFEEPMFRLFTALYANDVIGVRGFQWGLVETVWMVVTLLAGLPLGRIVDVIGRKKSILLAYLFFTPSSIFFIFARGFSQALIAFLFFALGGALIGPAYGALQADLIPRDKRGRIMGIIGTLNILATVPSSALGGFLYQTNPAAPFVLAIILGIATVSVIVFLVKEPRKKEI